MHTFIRVLAYIHDNVLVPSVRVKHRERAKTAYKTHSDYSIDTVTGSLATLLQSRTVLLLPSQTHSVQSCESKLGRMFDVFIYNGHGSATSCPPTHNQLSSSTDLDRPQLSVTPPNRHGERKPARRRPPPGSASEVSSASCLCPCTKDTTQAGHQNCEIAGPVVLVRCHPCRGRVNVACAA